MNDELSEDQKQKIEEEEKYRSQVRQKFVEKPRHYEPVSRSSQSGCLKYVFILAIVGVVIVAIQSAINPVRTLERAQTLGESQQLRNVLPVKELMKKKESQIRADYGDFISNYSNTGLTPSKKVRITGFDMGEKAQMSRLTTA